MDYRTEKSFAQEMDHKDPLKSFRSKFLIPVKNGKEKTYFLGNSLGLQPKKTRAYLERELQKWQDLGVDGHFKGENPWYNYHEYTKSTLSKLAGCNKSEVVMMNNLTSNLHFLLVSFYQPNQDRFKIITEEGAFPSDQYVLESQVRYHGYDPNDAILEIKPREGEYTLRTDDILNFIERHKDDACLVFMGGLQYYTGQVFDMQQITAKAHSCNMIAGFDLAHAAGNVPLSLSKWDVDFAAWCGYKYLNGGPGGTSAVFVNQKYANDSSLQRFAGWWGHDEEARFQMEKGFIPMKGADGWQVSNSNILSAAALWASLDVFEETEPDTLRKKSILLTGYMEFLLTSIPSYQHWFEIITPSNPNERGCQLSLFFHKMGRAVFEHLESKEIIVDWREPNVIRAAPVPLYNTFEEVYYLYESLLEVISNE